MALVHELFGTPSYLCLDKTHEFMYMYYRINKFKKWLFKQYWKYNNCVLHCVLIKIVFIVLLTYMYLHVNEIHVNKNRNKV